MNEDEKKKLKSIAFNLIFFKNIKLKNNVYLKKIPIKTFFELDNIELKSLGVKKEELSNMKRYKEIAEKEIEIANTNGIDLIFIDDKEYPELLKHIFNPPLYLYKMGELGDLNQMNISIVGTRRPDSYGKYIVRRFVEELVYYGFTIVSGMAIGIDSLSHEIAIKNNSTTIGVNPAGLLYLYPKTKRQMFKLLVKRGAIISEFPLKIEPRTYLFPIRNRIISGLSRVLLVMRASLRSGTLITARHSIEQGREVYAVPGNIDNKLSEGCNFLIKSGAKPLYDLSDVLFDYGLEHKDKKSNDLQLSEKEVKILNLIEVNENKSLDYFVESLDFEVSEILSIMMSLMLKGIIIQDSGGYRRVR